MKKYEEFLNIKFIFGAAVFFAGIIIMILYAATMTPFYLFISVILIICGIMLIELSATKKKKTFEHKTWAELTTLEKDVKRKTWRKK